MPARIPGFDGSSIVVEIAISGNKRGNLRKCLATAPRGALLSPLRRPQEHNARSGYAIDDNRLQHHGLMRLVLRVARNFRDLVGDLLALHHLAKNGVVPG